MIKDHAVSWVRDLPAVPPVWPTLDRRHPLAHYSDTPEFYQVRDGSEYAYVMLHERTGNLSINSSYGNFAYQWTAIGTFTLKDFLSDLNMDYFCQKAYQGEYVVFDLERSIRSLKLQVIEVCTHRNESLKFVLDALDEADGLDGYTFDEFDHNLTMSDTFSELLDGDFQGIAVSKVNPQCVAFWSRLWPKIIVWTR